MNVKLMIAVALSRDSKLLVLDEPTSGLDPVARDELCDIMLDYVSDGRRSVLFSTHISADLERVADHITFILNGKVVFSKGKDMLLDEYVAVQGDTSLISEKQRCKIIGIRIQGSSLTGLARRTDLNDFNGLSVRTATLDEIVVGINREASHE